MYYFANKFLYQICLIKSQALNSHFNLAVWVEKGGHANVNSIVWHLKQFTQRDSTQ